MCSTYTCHELRILWPRLTLRFINWTLKRSMTLGRSPQGIEHNIIELDCLTHITTWRSYTLNILYVPIWHEVALSYTFLQYSVRFKFSKKSTNLHLHTHLTNTSYSMIWFLWQIHIDWAIHALSRKHVGSTTVATHNSLGFHKQLCTLFPCICWACHCTHRDRYK